MRTRRSASSPVFTMVTACLTGGLMVSSLTSVARAETTSGRQVPSTSAAPAAPATWTRTEAAAAVVHDLAVRMKIDEARVRLVKASDETWSDATFGCTGRKPLAEPSPVPGYAFTLEADGRLYRYRTDRAGTLRRCGGVKPVAPIERHR